MAGTTLVEMVPYPGGWHIINNTYYYMYSNGSMAADTWIGSYYVNASGAWVPGKVKYTAGWIQNGSRWWYRHQDGKHYQWLGIY